MERRRRRRRGSDRKSARANERAAGGKGIQIKRSEEGTRKKSGDFYLNFATVGAHLSSPLLGNEDGWISLRDPDWSLIITVAPHPPNLIPKDTVLVIHPGDDDVSPGATPGKTLPSLLPVGTVVSVHLPCNQVSILTVLCLAP